MLKLNQRGAIQFLIPLILLAGIIAGVYLVQRTQIFKPRATVSGPISPQTSFILNDPRATEAKLVGSEFEIQLWVRSDIDAANLFAAKLHFTQDVIEVVRVDKSGSFINNWVEEYFDNSGGIVSLVGGVPNPGHLTTNQPNASFMASVIFRAKAAGSAKIFFDESSAIYSNASNVNILSIKDGLIVSTAGVIITPGPTPAPSPSPVSDIGIKLQPSSIKATAPIGGQVKVADLINTSSGLVNFELRLPQFFKFGSPVNSFSPVGGDMNAGGSLPVQVDIVNKPGLGGIYAGTGTLTNTTNGQSVSVSIELTVIEVTTSPSPVPSATPVPGTGDGNNDGKVNLIDLSILLSDFNKESGFRTGIDLNGDGKINTFDFSLMRNLLTQRGIIRG